MLPVAEQRPWEKLWADVDKLLKRCDEPFSPPAYWPLLSGMYPRGLWGLRVPEPKKFRAS
jgi:hypothetical protein